jgi:small subunit ribosomal protein S16
MAVKIRLARHGKKGYPFYHIVAADSHAPRDGKFIEKLGTYNPNTDPATIELDIDRAVYWLNVGALPTKTGQRILSYKGVLLKKHLLEGVKKGGLTEEAAEQKFNAWLSEKNAKIQAKKDSLTRLQSSEQQARIEAENKVKEAKEAALAKKRIEEAEAVAAAAKATEPAEPETATENVPSTEA